ncbi:MAG: cobalt-precorrin-5B (C(1))-methyltransferase [Solirubrobacteraceae bacterium]
MVRPELLEPNLPASARRAATTLRRGWTTGTCAAAAAKAASVALATGTPPARIEVPLLRPGARHEFEVERCELRGAEATAVVVKDAGDDPDVTHGAHLTAAVRRRAEPGIELASGDGVGVVTRPGLGLEIGAPAINPGPRRQIVAAVGEALDLERRGARVAISVPGGERMARRTTNPRLGIVGGISILGTTGIVRPFSTAAWRASVGQAIDVMHAQGMGEFVLTTGGRTERAAMALLPGLDDVCFIEVGDFTGYALRRGAALGLERCFFVGMAGKLSKLAAGIMMTHWTRSKVDPGMLAELTATAGGDPALSAAVAAANTARHAYELWREAGLDAAGDLLCARAATNLSRFVDGRLDVHAVMVDFEDLSVTGASPAARQLLAGEVTG